MKAASEVRERFNARRPDEPKDTVRSHEVSVSLIICAGGECRGVRHDRHLSAASSFQIGVLQGSAHGIQGNAGPGLAPAALHLQPAVTPVETLRDGWRGLSRSSKAFHTQGPCMGFGSVCLAGGLYSELRARTAFILAARTQPPSMTSRDFVPMAGDYSDLCQPSQSH